MNLEAVLTRTVDSDEGTFGLLRFGADTVYTIELPWRENLRQRSCIPAGRYPCVPHRSPRMGRVYAVLQVPGRSSILLHAANFAGDVRMGWHSELQGCIAPALRRGLLRNPAGRMQRAGLVSRPALSKLMQWADGKPFDLTIKAAS